MPNYFSLSKFNKAYPDNSSCLEKIKNISHPNGIRCRKCKKQTRHYKIRSRPVFSCKICRSQIHPLKNTLFTKSSTPLRLWFFAIYLMTLTGGTLSARQLQKELGVSYKTAWRIRNLIYKLMRKNEQSLLFGKDEKVFKWTFLNKLEIKVVQKQSPSP